MHKIIFLDIDGFLNSKFWDENHQKEISDGTLIDEDKVKLLSEIMDRTKANIVLHSGWRFWFDKEIQPLREESRRLVEILKKYNIVISDVTPDFTTEEIRKTKMFGLVKPQEILTWIKKHSEVENWIVLEDLYLGNEEVQAHQITTDSAVGLTQEDVELAVEMLTTVYDYKALAKPPLYTKTKVAFWDDEHISKQMLKAHLDPEFEGASRNLKFIEKSVSWIKEMVSPQNYPLLLDVGCGPGIYAEKFSKEGYQVTGIDFSKRSIDYAQKSALQQKLNITYLYQNYLDMNLQQEFDFATLIYCDYGALSTQDRQIIMNNIYNHLKPGGKFLLDVFSMEKYNTFQEKQTWENCQNGGFWREEKYLAFNGSYKYSDNVTLEQTSIIVNNKITNYYIWDTYFTKETLMKEAMEAGFKVCQVFGDVAGETYHQDSLTIAILLEK